MTDAEKLRMISDLFVEWTNEPYSDLGHGMAGHPAEHYLDAIGDVMTNHDSDEEATP